MRVIRNILSQLHVYTVWLILSAVLWGFVFGLLTDAVTFEVSADEDVMAGIEEETYVKVYYEGALSGIAVDAVKVEKE